ncbi:Iron-sulfur cluster carrier protein [subsurface metagenome]
MSEPRKIPILSLKGGTGKTTICLGLAEGLQEMGKKVGLLDVDIHASALPRAIHLKHDPGYDPILGGKLRPVMHNGFQLFSIGLLFTEETPNMWDGETKASAVKQIATTAIAWDDDLEWVIVDTPPTSGDEIQSLLQYLPNIYGAVVICQPNDLAVLALHKNLNVLREAETPIAGIIANMAGYRCPHCGQVSNLFDRTPSDIQTLAEELHVRYLGQVPFAGPEERKQALREILNGILRNPPARLDKKKGGVTRWLLEKVLR